MTAGISRPVDEATPLRDNILGTEITGTGHTIGQVQARSIEHQQQAMIETVLSGVTKSSTVGRNGPALIYSQGESQIRGAKNLVLSGDGFHGLPAQSQVITQTQVTGVGTTKHGVVDRLIKKVAWKRIPQQKAAGERIAAQHAEQMLNRRLDVEAAEQLNKANADYKERFRWPLVRTGTFPRLLQFSTTSDYLHVKATESADSRISTPTAAPALSGSPDMAVRMHESLVNNFASGLLSGRTLTQADTEQIAINLLGKVPDELKPDDEPEPWSITFAPRDPIGIRIDNGVVE